MSFVYIQNLNCCIYNNNIIQYITRCNNVLCHVTINDTLKRLTTNFKNKWQQYNSGTPVRWTPLGNETLSLIES